MTPRRLLPVLLVVLAASRCFCFLAPQGGLGDHCTASKDCAIGLVCVRMDEEDADAALVCLPALSFDRTDCLSDEDCLKTGMPVEAYCSLEQHCACDDLLDDVQLSCNSGTLPGRLACSCVAKDESAVGDECGHPEECASGICDGAHCLGSCSNDDECGGMTTCDDDQLCT